MHLPLLQYVWFSVQKLYINCRCSYCENVLTGLHPAPKRRDTNSGQPLQIANSVLTASQDHPKARLKRTVLRIQIRIPSNRVTSSCGIYFVTLWIKSWALRKKMFVEISRSFTKTYFFQLFLVVNSFLWSSPQIKLFHHEDIPPMGLGGEVSV